MRIIIAGGGSGGHFFPALAVMHEIIGRDKDMEYLYVGSDSGIESRKWTLPEKNRRLLAVRGFTNKSATRKAASLFLLIGSLRAAAGIIREFKPDAVLGVGGYASFPAVMAAVLMRVPAAIHEQNSVPGLANKVLSRFVGKVFLSFAASKKYFPAGKTLLTGLPIRYTPAGRNGRRPAVKTVLVLGGSQGARQVNDMVMNGLASLSDIKDRVVFIHQTGPSDYRSVREAYDRHGFHAEVHEFIDDMAPVFGKADLAVSRAGASTLFELAAYGIPSILIPYPSAASDHQTLNARDLSDSGGALVIPAARTEPDMLARLLRELSTDDNRLTEMSAAMTRWAKPSAAASIVDGMIALAGKG